MTDGLAIATAWRLGGLVLAAVASALALHVVPDHAVAVPGRGGVASMLWPLCPVLYCSAVPRSAAVLCREHELLSVRPRVRIRLAMVAIVVAGTAPSLWSPFPVEVLARNAMFLVGVALLSAVVLPAPLAWLPAVALPAAMWLLGTTRAGAEPWALLLQPAGATGELGAAAVALVVGAGAYGSVRPR